MNKFKKLGFVKYNGGLQMNSSLLSVVLHDWIVLHLSISIVSVSQHRYLEGECLGWQVHRRGGWLLFARCYDSDQTQHANPATGTFVMRNDQPQGAHIAANGFAIHRISN